MTCGVYSITQISTGRYYVGSSLRVEARLKEHARDLSSGTHHCTFLQRAWNKAVGEGFVFALVSACESSERLSAEQALIDKAVSAGLAFNASKTALSPCPETLQRSVEARWAKPDSRDRQSKAAKARFLDPVAREIQTAVNRNNNAKNWSDPALRTTMLKNLVDGKKRHLEDPNNRRRQLDQLALARLNSPLGKRAS